MCLRSEFSARLFEGVDDLLQDIRAVVCNLLENRVGIFLQLSALLLTHLQLPLQLFGAHSLEVLLPVFRVAVVVVSGRRELAEDAGVSIVAEVCQVGDVKFELTAVLGQG